MAVAPNTNWSPAAALAVVRLTFRFREIGRIHVRDVRASRSEGHSIGTGIRPAHLREARRVVEATGSGVQIYNRRVVDRRHRHSRRRHIAQVVARRAVIDLVADGARGPRGIVARVEVGHRLQRRLVLRNRRVPAQRQHARRSGVDDR